MRRATTDEEGPIREAMARHGVRVREVWVRPGEAVAAWAPVRGRMQVREGFLTAPAWRRAAILAHEAGHVRLRHVPWCVALVGVAEVALLAGRLALAPVILAGPGALLLGTAGVLLGEAGVWAGVSALARAQEFAADRWAVEHGGITGCVWLGHLALTGHPVERGWVDRLLATHPRPERRAGRVRRLLRGRPPHTTTVTPRPF